MPWYNSRYILSVFSLEMAQYGELILLSIKDYHKHLLSKSKILCLTSTFPCMQYLKIIYVHLHRYNSWKDWCKTDCQHYKAYRVWNPFLYKLNEMEKWPYLRAFLFFILVYFWLIFWSLPHSQYYSKEKREKATQLFSCVAFLLLCYSKVYLLQSHIE